MLLKAFHYSDSKIDKFSLDFLGKGYDQYGAGVYFSSERLDRGDYIYNIKLTPTKLITSDSSFTDKEIKFLMDASPDLEDKLSDWSENYHSAYQMLFDSVKDSGNMGEQYETIWADVYDFHDVDSVKVLLGKLIELGYDGRQIDGTDINQSLEDVTQKFYLIFNIDVIQIVEVDKINEMVGMVFNLLDHVK